MSTSTWNPADHATYCPQHYPRPADAGGSSWLCVCSGPLVELRAAGQALIDAAPVFGSNSWAEAFDVWEDVVAEQERLEALAERENEGISDEAAEPSPSTASRSASARASGEEGE